MTKLRTVRKSIKNSKKNRSNKNKTHRRKSRGGCGCNKKKFLGGGQSDLAMNPYVNDPSRLPIGGSERITHPVVHGGKKNRKSQLRNKRGMKGGMRDFLLGENTGVAAGFGSSSGSMAGANIIGGVSSLNPSIYNQPIGDKFGGHNPPLV